MLAFNTPMQSSLQIAKCARSQRLSQNLSRKTLAKISGVPEASIKRFELTGQIAFLALLKIAYVLGCMEDFDPLFAPKENVSLEQVLMKERTRGRT
jgi:transcriptional regulator with XRE-family HTH domain